MKGRITKAKMGERLSQALKQIAVFQKQQLDWGIPELASALDMSTSQARVLLANLTLKGHLVTKEVLVKKSLPVLTDAGRTAQAA